MLRRMRWWGAWVVIALALTPGLAFGDDATEQGRQAYMRGQQLSREEQWGDALAKFEEAAAARDAPLVQFSIAYCQRALGRYVAARHTILRVLADPTGLDPAQLDDAKAYHDRRPAALRRRHVRRLSVELVRHGVRNRRDVSGQVLWTLANSSGHFNTTQAVQGSGMPLEQSLRQCTNKHVSRGAQSLIPMGCFALQDCSQVTAPPSKPASADVEPHATRQSL